MVLFKYCDPKKKEKMPNDYHHMVIHNEATLRFGFVTTESWREPKLFRSKKEAYDYRKIYIDDIKNSFPEHYKFKFKIAKVTITRFIRVMD